MVSILGTVITVLGIYSVFWYLDPSGEDAKVVCLHIASLLPQRSEGYTLFAPVLMMALGPTKHTYMYIYTQTYIYIYMYVEVY